MGKGNGICFRNKGCSRPQFAGRLEGRFLCRPEHPEGDIGPCGSVNPLLFLNGEDTGDETPVPTLSPVFPMGQIYNVVADANQNTGPPYEPDGE